METAMMFFSLLIGLLISMESMNDELVDSIYSLMELSLLEAKIVSSLFYLWTILVYAQLWML